MLSVRITDRNPDLRSLGAVLSLARENGVTTVFVRRASSKLAQSIAEQLGSAKVVELDVLERLVSEYAALAAQLAEAAVARKIWKKTAKLLLNFLRNVWAGYDLDTVTEDIALTSTRGIMSGSSAQTAVERPLSSR